MKRPLDTTALDRLFRTVRTFPSWQDRQVSDERIRDLYDLLR